MAGWPIFGGWPTFNHFYVQHFHRGYPILAFFWQGWASLMPVLYDLLRSDRINRHAQAFPCPALRKEREGRGTHSVGDASEIKSLGHPQFLTYEK